MWKPGSAKPTNNSQSLTSPIQKWSSSSPAPPKKNDSPGDSSRRRSAGSLSSASPRKILSGSTMNMRFMKRRKDAINNKSSNENETKDNDKKKRKLKPHSSSPRHYGHQQNETKLNDISKNNSPRDLKTQQYNTDKVLDMDVDDDGDNYDDDDHHHHENQLDNNDVLLSDDYYQASSVDMYGIGASLIGRRSFRGFNPAIERIWKDSKESLTSCNSEKNQRS